MKRLLALIICLCMLLPGYAMADGFSASADFLPLLLADLEQLLNSTTPQLSASLADPDGNAASAGLSQTAAGDFAAFFSTPDGQFIISEAASYISNTAGVSTVATEQLLSALTGANAQPAYTENELNAVKNLFTDLFSAIPDTAFSATQGEDSFMLHADLDELLLHVDQQLPLLLDLYRTDLDSLFAKLPPLSGSTEPLTCAVLIDALQHLELIRMDTGLALDVNVYVGEQFTTIVGNVCGAAIEISISDEAVHLSITPESTGIPYRFSTDDLLILAEIVAEMPEMTQLDEGAVSTATVLLTRENIIGSIRRNGETIDQLLANYRSWIELFSGERITPDSLSSDCIASYLTDALPEVLFRFTRVTDRENGVSTLEGEVGVISVSFHEVNSSELSSWTASFSSTSNAFPIVVSADYSRNSRTRAETFSLSFPEGLLPWFSALSWRYEPGYGGSRISVTTDSDVFHLHSDPAWRNSLLDIKLGAFGLDLRKEYGALKRLHVDAPGFFAALNVHDNGFSLTSTFLNLEITGSASSLNLRGAVSEDGDDWSSFSALIDSDNQIVMVSVQPSDAQNLYFTCRPGEMTLMMDGDAYVLHSNGDGTYSISLNGELVMTMVTEVSESETGSVYRIRLVKGDDLTSLGYCLTLSFDPEIVELPFDASEVSPEAFIDQLF